MDVYIEHAGIGAEQWAQELALGDGTFEIFTAMKTLVRVG